jgi:hypothetical protein
MCFVFVVVFALVVYFILFYFFVALFCRFRNRLYCYDSDCVLYVNKWIRNEKSLTKTEKERERERKTTIVKVNIKREEHKKTGLF